MGGGDRVGRGLLLTAGLGLLLVGWLMAPVWQAYLGPRGAAPEPALPEPAPPTPEAPGPAAPAAPAAVLSEFPALPRLSVPFEFPLLDEAPAPEDRPAVEEFSPPAAPMTFAEGGVVSEALIVLKPHETGNYKLINLLELARLVNSAGPDGFPVAAGATFSFLHSGLMDGNYVLGRDNLRNLVRAGGICAGSSLIATLVTEAAAADAPIALTDRTPHHTYEPPYHQVNMVGGRRVPVVDAAVLEGPDVFQDLRLANQDTARYAFRFFLLAEEADGTQVPVDEAAAWAAYDADPYGPIAATVYFYGRLMRLPWPP
jgi:hypothetical protein